METPALTQADAAEVTAVAGCKVVVYASGHGLPRPAPPQAGEDASRRFREPACAVLRLRAVKRSFDLILLVAAVTPGCVISAATAAVVTKRGGLLEGAGRPRYGRLHYHRSAGSGLENNADVDRQILAIASPGSCHDPVAWK